MSDNKADDYEIVLNSLINRVDELKKSINDLKLSNQETDFQMILTNQTAAQTEVQKDSSLKMLANLANIIGRKIGEGNEVLIKHNKELISEASKIEQTRAARETEKASDFKTILLITGISCILLITILLIYLFDVKDMQKEIVNNQQIIMSVQKPESGEVASPKTQSVTTPKTIKKNKKQKGK